VRRRATLACLALALFALALAPAAAQASFGIHDLQATALNEDKSIDLEAGSHPFEYTLSFAMNQDAEENPEGILNKVEIALPPGFLGDPEAVPRCTGAQFEGFPSLCPGNTQIGVLHANLIGIGPDVTSPIYNLTPSLGVPASFGFGIAGFNIIQEASIRSGTDYGATITVATPTTLKVASVKATIWGDPPDSAHDSERQCISPEGGLIFGCSSDVQKRPFLSMPTACGAPLQTTLTVHSFEGATDSRTIESLGEGETPEGIEGCEAPGFEPSIAAAPETSAADSPSGLHFSMHLPQNLSPEGTATAHLKNAVVTLPRGLSVNPSAADGLGACGPSQIGLKTAPGAPPPFEFTPGPAECPANSKVGTVQVQTPLVDHPLPGTVYLAKQGENPFGSLIALYITVQDPITGLIAKLPARVEPDPVTGQLVTTVSDSPQVPFEDFVFDFSGGPRASLTTPPTCGTYTTETDLTPWTAPAAPDAHPQSSFQVNSAPGGGACASSEAQMPFAPSFEAGTTAPLAGAFSPFVLRLSRENGMQGISSLNATVPPGVTAKLAGLAECSDAQIARAQARRGAGEGALEQASPSCPAASQIGVVNVGAGSGNPLFVGGNAYLAGPYKGAPLSVAIVVPAVAGPFDLGTVVVRSALFVNEETGQGTVKSDPAPRILQGLPVDVRTIAVKLNPGFILNPTSCEAKSMSAEAISTTGAVAKLQNRFQVGGCRGLDYTPKLALSMKGATKRGGHPAFRAVLTQPAGQANSQTLSVALPPTEFIDQNHISNPCTRPQFAAGQCPPGSVLGTARAFTPLLEAPLEGKAYFRSNGGERALPDLVVSLHGQVNALQVGFVDALHKKGSESSRVRTTFAALPDVPLSKVIVELKGGKKGLLVNSANICKVANLATVKMRAHNGKVDDFDSQIATSCAKKQG
jgi:hypothetical protein